MTYSSLKDCVLDLEKQGDLLRIPDEVDPHLEMAALHRLVFEAGGPAVFYERVKGSPFPAVSNLYGTEKRCRFLFRDTLDAVTRIVRCKAEPMKYLAEPWKHMDLPFKALNALPMKVAGGPVLDHQTSIQKLPQIQSWPLDGGSFILLPQVFTENPDKPGIFNSNLGMYRVQLSGNEYVPDNEIGLHYQIRRDIGIHHAAAIRRGEPLKVSIFVGGPPAHAFAAVMYLPEGLTELHFAGMLAGRQFRYTVRNGFTIAAEADFCITGYVDTSSMKPEGPFGDHLGYYSLKHDFPFMRVESVYHRKDAIWPFTVVGRPPQEDSMFGKLVHEIAGPMISKEIPGVKAVHAVDAAGVHPLMLAIGQERYVPYQVRKPQEILTLANAILGYGPCSLAKYLMIAAGEDNLRLEIEDIPAFLAHVLERADWTKDLHFQTCATMDTLDYSGTGFNEGSKLVIAAAGPKKRELCRRLPGSLVLPRGFSRPFLMQPGIIVVQAPAYHETEGEAQMNALSECLKLNLKDPGVALVVAADDSEFCAANINNFLWVTFTRSNPSHDLFGVDSFISHKHWGCKGALIIDSRIKPHHAPVVEEDKAARLRAEKILARARAS